MLGVFCFCFCLPFSKGCVDGRDTIAMTMYDKLLRSLATCEVSRRRMQNNIWQTFPSCGGAQIVFRAMKLRDMYSGRGGGGVVPAMIGPEA